MSYLNGLPVMVEPERPRYTLPADVPPPTGMTRDEFAQWSRRVCGIQAPLIPDGQVLNLAGAMHMNAKTWARIRRELSGATY